MLVTGFLSIDSDIEMGREWLFQRTRTTSREGKSPLDPQHSDLSTELEF